MDALEIDRAHLVGDPRARLGAVSDPGRYLHFMSGITRWEVVGARRRARMGAV